MDMSSKSIKELEAAADSRRNLSDVCPEDHSPGNTVKRKVVGYRLDGSLVHQRTNMKTDEKNNYANKTNLQLLTISAGSVKHVMLSQVELHAKSNLKDGMKKYNSENELQKSWDNVQKMFKCCGVNNKTDWYEVLNKTLPSSCCPGAERETCKEWSEQGCYAKAKNWLSDNIRPVLVFGVCISVVQILALVFSMQMYCQILHAEKNLD
ncbi:hypothetical protein AMECASPLE_001247 [Ameca splendens]|uniref:Uncharacterized protein n=1 Tax=Ameca splendens TaxID=208324 RepID=A0ABV0ZIV8_9TELE